MSDRHKTQGLGKATLLVLGGLLAGLALSLVLPEMPFGPGSSDMGHGKHTPGQQLWTCGMDPQVIEDEPGRCPICGMDLVPMQGTGPEHEGHQHPETLWTCPMDPQVIQDQPGKCPICGMDLVPMDPGPDAQAGDDRAEIRIDPAVVQNMNVRTARVERRDLYHPLRTVGYLDYDQERMVTVATRYSGWIEKTYVNYVGEPVRKGAPLFEIYSPELVQTEEELLSALRFARDMENAPADARRRAESLAESARTRLGYWDISESQIQELEATGEVVRTLTVVAPASGLVMKRMPGLEGMAVSPGMELFHIADLSTLWMSVELFEDQMEWVEVGTPAEFTLSYFPGEAFHGRVRYLEPELSERTRTLAVRIEVPNPQGRLRKGMFATVAFATTAVKDALVVPTEAVLRTGQRSVLIVALGEGRFLPRDVLLGHTVEGSTQILEGVTEGEEVVTSSQFLLDSESKLREAIQKMIAGSDHTGHGG